jgi:hypothetical protein
MYVLIQIYFRFNPVTSTFLLLKELNSVLVLNSLVPLNDIPQNITFTLDKPYKDPVTHIIVKFPSEHIAIRVAQRCIMVKAIYERKSRPHS